MAHAAAAVVLAAALFLTVNRELTVKRLLCAPSYVQSVITNLPQCMCVDVSCSPIITEDTT